MAHPGGRPLKFKNDAELKKKIDEYFDNCDPHVEQVQVLIYPKTKTKDGSRVTDYSAEPQLTTVSQISAQKPYTITGLALALGTSRKVLLDYEDRKEFSDTIKEAKLKIENFVEARLFENNVAGPIFNLVNNYGWKNKQEVEESGEKKVIIETRTYDDKRKTD